MLSVNTNINAQSAANQTGATQRNLGSSMEKLTTGLRINRAADDVAGTALASRFESFANRNEQYVRNAEDGINMIQTFEGALKQTESLLQRMKELATQAENGTQTADDQALIQKEYDQLSSEITRNAEAASYNGIKMLGAAPTTATADIAVGQGNANVITVNAVDTTAATLAVDVLVLDSATNPTADDWKTNVHDVLDAATKTVNDARADMGAQQNRLDFAITNLTNVGENASQALSSLRDTDFASQSAELSKQQVLAQTSQAMLKQANEQTQAISRLVQ